MEVLHVKLGSMQKFRDGKECFLRLRAEDCFSIQGKYGEIFCGTELLCMKTFVVDIRLDSSLNPIEFCTI